MGEKTGLSSLAKLDPDVSATITDRLLRHQFNVGTENIEAMAHKVKAN